METYEKKRITGEAVLKLEVEVLKEYSCLAGIGAQNLELQDFRWDVLENEEISFDDPSRIIIMRQLDEKFKELTETPRKSVVQYDLKTYGVQYGIKAKVILQSTEEKVFHIKTHSKGRLADQHIVPKAVNPRELFVYKIFEHTKIGCESHFLERSITDVYIATMDAAGHGGSFDTFARVTKGDAEYGKSIWGSLSIHSDPTKNIASEIEMEIQTDVTAQNFLLQLSSLDMLTRILQLSDLIDNPDNFGFLKREGQNPVLKVVDFHVFDPKGVIASGQNFEAFLAGNGWFKYSGVHPVIRYGLRKRPVKDRVATALDVLTKTTLSKLDEHVRRAYEDVRSYIVDTAVFEDVRSQLLEDLDLYNKAVRSNIQFFTNAVQSWNPDAVTWKRRTKI
eukprot:gene10668-22262_t